MTVAAHPQPAVDDTFVMVSSQRCISPPRGHVTTRRANEAANIRETNRQRLPTSALAEVWFTVENAVNFYRELFVVKQSEQFVFAFSKFKFCLWFIKLAWLNIRLLWFRWGTRTSCKRKCIEHTRKLIICHIFIGIIFYRTGILGL